jgi:hypothetical protein
MNFWFWMWLLDNQSDTRITGRGCATVLVVFAAITLALWLSLQGLHKSDPTLCESGPGLKYLDPLRHMMMGCP